MLVGAALAQEDAVDAERAANLVILDETRVRNLGIEMVQVLETDFEESIFALGRIEAIPSRVAVVSSRISGRVIKITKHEGDTVEANEVVAIIESRQPGNPPPKIELRAPISGLVTESHVKLGEPIDPDTHILDVTDLEEVYAVARIPEDRAGRLGVGTKAEIRIAALPGEKFAGELLRFGTVADRESGTIDALFRMPNMSGRLRSDMRAEFSITLGKRADVLAVPREAVQGGMEDPIIFLKDFELENAFIRSPIIVGQTTDRYVEVIAGVFPGDEVVTKGSYPLSFAGGGSVSLKEALDDAHGHEHNEDGSELTPAQKAAKKAEENAAGGGSNWTQLTTFFASTTGLLLVLLILSALGRNRKSTTA
ncbi:MAG: cobalt-zinc-cadmium efflux system membrane fusion protein [Verrucomicrobiales bacterium]|jgi:cobalt-zinc-cadmium efflux system membrane fusion protein